MSMNVSEASPDTYENTLRAHVRPASGFPSVPLWLFSAACGIGDFLIVVGATLRAPPLADEYFGLSLVNLASAAVLGLACVTLFHQGGLYRVATLRHSLRYFIRLALRWVFFALIVLASPALVERNYVPNLHHLLLFSVIGLSGLLLQRLLIEYALGFCLARGNFIHSVAIIGDTVHAGALAARLENIAGFHVAGMFADYEDESDALIGARERLVVDLIAERNVDFVLIAEPGMAPRRLRGLLRELRQHPVSVYATPDTLSLPDVSCNWLRPDSFSGLRLVPLARCPSDKTALLVKGLVDRLLAGLILLGASPLLLICMAGILISDPGPVFFTQKRIGYKGREFSIFKFRTMYVTPQPNVALTTQNDPRVFPFGRLLRKTSLDELPQIINVLMGEMSLVGPRPHMPQATAAGLLYFDAVAEYTARHRVKPGITGWAQVNGWRGPTETVDQIQSRVEHDLYYIENWSLLLDFMVLFRTAFSLFGKNVF